ncbi:MAG: hypothetical protein DHS20C18_34940 [Saprospiraceae bacterium]|nr:MAG: hypothetical protein DHS20C18_34940 [Saprospiraceae bacterium]
MNYTIPQNLTPMYSKKIAGKIAELNPQGGFHIFTTKDKKSSFFYYAAPDGSVLLISRPYSRARSAERALQNLSEKSPSFELMDGVGNHQFQILNGNKKPVAQSKPFEKASEAKLAIRDIKALIGSHAAIVETSTEPIEPEISTNTPLPNVGKTSFRHSFRLDFYPDEDQPNYRGKIEHLLSRKTQTIKGLDIEAIETFIKKFLNTRPKRTPKPVSIEEKPIQMKLWQANQVSLNFNFPVGSTLEVALNLREKVQHAVEAEIYLKPMEIVGEVRQLVGRQVLSSNKDTTRTPVYTQAMTPGFYQLIAKVNDLSTDGNPSPPSYESRQIIHLY